MPRKNLEKMIKSYDDGDWSHKMTPENEVEFTVDLKHSGCFVNVDPSLVQEVSELAREKKTTVQKIVEKWIRNNLRKLKAA